MRYAVINEFSGREVSCHRTLRAAARAAVRLYKMTVAANPGGNSYLPVSVEAPDGTKYRCDDVSLQFGEYAGTTYECVPTNGDAPVFV